jgi:hypothetical protein
MSAAERAGVTPAAVREPPGSPGAAPEAVRGQAPEFDADTMGKPEYRDRLGTYYDDTHRTV